MIAASSKNIKDAIERKSVKELQELILRLVRFKKENKELATYLLFYEGVEQEFVADAKSAINDIFADVNTKTVFYAKKGLRKMLRTGAKFSKYSADKTTALEVAIEQATLLTTLPNNLKTSTLIKNMYASNLKKILATIKLLHADIQYDYKKAIENLPNNL